VQDYVVNLTKKGRMSMKRIFSRVMIMAMVLFATSGIEGMNSLLNLGSKAVVKSADDLIEALGGVGVKLSDNAVSNLTKAGVMQSDEFLEAVVKTMKASVSNGSKLTDEAIETMANNLAKASDAGVNITKLSDDALAKVASKDVSKMTTKDFGKFLDEIDPKMPSAERAALKQSFASSKGILGRTTDAVSDLGSSIKQSLNKTGQSLNKSADNALYDEMDNLKVIRDNPALDVAQRNAAANRLKELKYLSKTSPFGRGLRGAGKYFGMTAMAGIGTVYVAILFSIPTLFHSAFVAQQHENAMLQTYIPPTKFGNIVMQLPDSVIDMTNPMNSQFVYYGIPVHNPGEKLSAQAKAAYPGVSDPTAKNKVSAGVDNSFARAFSGMATKEIKIPRYNLDARALASLPVFVSYTDQSWLDWASNGIPDAAFTQTMINLNTGYIFYADGSSDGTPAAGLVATPGSGKTVQSFMSKKLGQLKNAGSVASFREFHDSYTAGKAGKVVSSLSDQFDCSCLDGGSLNGDVVQKCSGAKKSTCLLTSALNQIAAGLVLNSQGQVLRPDQDVATELANGALGQVVPIQGYGDKFDDILRMFPGAEKQALANSGVLTISLGSNLDAAPADIQGAPADNYAAKGVYVYQCKNTPLAKMLRSQSGGSAGASEYITDFIIFLDQDLNQVPLMAPVQDPKNYNFIKMDLNPAIKYFSTIIGSVDGNGGFSFLPQLNIQSPAALTAKGLPATFAPLYGLQASNGSLSINYNQNLSSAVGGAAQALAGHAKLGQQFKTMQSALLTLLNAGPFGKYQLTPVADDIQPNIGGVQLKMYTGFNSYPVSQDAAFANCSDVLIPLSAAGKTVTLPSNNVTQYYGLVTDLTYTVRDDGTIAVDPTGFANSPLSQDLAIDSKKTSQFYWMNKLTDMGQSSDPEFAMPESLVSFVTQARQAWINWIAQHGSNKATQQEFAGVKVAGTSTVLTIANQQAMANGLYIYTASPCPSSQAQDYFVLINSSNPQANDAKLGSMSALQATAATNMLSIISGMLYNVSGQQVKNSVNVAYSVNPADVLKGLNAKNPKALSDDFKAKLNISNGQAAIASKALIYPFNFGGLQLGIYQADLDASIYLYVDASGAAASANFVPSDYFIAVDSATSPNKVGTKLNGNTQFMVSLISGNVYAPAGIQSVMDAGLVTKIRTALAPAWRSGVAQQVAAAQASFAAMVDIQQKATDQMNAAPVPNSGAVKFDQAKNIIANLASVDYLPAPYDMLKQDAASGMYILITPADAQASQFLYTFFDVPNSFVDGNGNPMRVGAMYDNQGNLLYVIRDLQLAVMQRQYGIAVDATGHEYLGVQNALPMLPLDPADKSLKPGVSGKSMIYSNDPQFPSFGITSPVSYLNSKFYIYFNTITQAYYAMQITSNDAMYIDIAGGAVYNLDGSARVETNPVAINKNNDVTDMLLAYASPEGFMQCVMKNSANNNMYSQFSNSSDSFQVAQDPATQNPAGLNTLVSVDAAASSVQVAQMPFAQDATSLPEISAMQQYNVYVDGAAQPAMYLASAMYAWQDLTLLPIDMASRSILKSIPDEKYNSVQLILKNKAPYAAIFAGEFYTSASAGAKDVYTLTSGSKKLTASVKMDAKTNQQYLEIVAGSVTYNYQYVFMMLSDNQLQNYRSNAWQVGVVASSTGQVILERSLPVDNAGNLQLVKVTMQSVVNAPSDTAQRGALQSNLGSIMQDSSTGRFITAISSGMYQSFDQDGYVDLENGILFDTTGSVVGYALEFADLMDIVNQLSVSVVRNENRQAGLRYRPMSQQAVQAVDNKRSVVSASNQASSRLLGKLSSKNKAKKKTKKNRKK
jgi:hypothetical protein